jgi:iron complex transport system substrate-binding protein
MAIDCQKNKPDHTYTPRESKSFSIDYYEGYRILHRGNDQVLLRNKLTKLLCQTHLFQIETPVEKVIMTSTTQLPALELLDVAKSLIGFQGRKYIYSNVFLKEKIIDISLPLIQEELLKIKPDLVMSYDLNISSKKAIVNMRKLNIPLVLNNDYLEQNSLARAEWIVYTASFFNKEADAIKIFDKIVLKYNTVKKMVKSLPKHKKILVGDIQNGKWVTCGGRSDFAQLISDAGGELLLASKRPTIQRRSLEDLYLISAPADVWLTQNNWVNKNELSKDSRYKKINAKKIFNNHQRISTLGANDYWEMGMARPDLLLEDLASILYPELFLKHTLFWYKQL